MVKGKVLPFRAPKNKALTKKNSKNRKRKAKGIAFNVYVGNFLITERGAIQTLR